MTRPYQICTRCILDTSDPGISFDQEGVCICCRNFDAHVKPIWTPDERGKQKLDAIVARIRGEGKNEEYDSIVGLSGGVDSSYLAHVAKKLGLRPLAVHVDTGWNSELAVKNIEQLVKSLRIDLHTHVVDWEEMRDLQVAFLKSGVANQDAPQDHVIFAALYACAVKNKIRHVLNGTNYATESLSSSASGYIAMDLRQLKGIHRQFGERPLKTFPTVSFFQYYIYYPFIRRMTIHRLLDYMLYNKDEAMKVLQQELGWRYYGSKHYESRFTKFFQGYYLPTRFGFDKRRLHLASLILSGQMTRDEARRIMSQPAYPPEELNEDKIFVVKKLGLTMEEFEQLLTAPKKTFRDYPSNYLLFRLKDRIMSFVRRVRA
jgi:N-acetyl sugar amidotransferase